MHRDTFNRTQNASADTLPAVFIKSGDKLELVISAEAIEKLDLDGLITEVEKLFS